MVQPAARLEGDLHPKEKGVTRMGEGWVGGTARGWWEAGFAAGLSAQMDSVLLIHQNSHDFEQKNASSGFGNRTRHGYLPPALEW